MKKLIYLVLSALFIGATGVAMAQDAATAPKPAHPRIHEVHERIKFQLKRIEAGVKSGKLTPEQAQALKDQIKAVQAQMEADFQANGKKELTPEQKKQLNEMLNESSMTIFDEKHPDAGAAKTGSPAGSTGTGSAPAASN